METFDLMAEYRKFLRRFGPQGWWPVYRAASSQPQATSRTRIRPELVEGRFGAFAIQRCAYPQRLTEVDRFQICVGAILTQNTAWTNVERAFTDIFSPPPGGRGSARGREHTHWAPKWFTSLSRSKLASLIRPTGYFNQKAKKLQIFSRWLLREYGGSLERFFRLPTHNCRLQLLSLWGIGPETADSMLLYAGRHPVFVVDAYTKRLLAHAVGVSNTQCLTLRTYDEYQRFFMDRLPHDASLFNEFHALIVAWGKAQKGTRTQQFVIARSEPQRATRQSR